MKQQQSLISQISLELNFLSVSAGLDCFRSGEITSPDLESMLVLSRFLFSDSRLSNSEKFHRVIGALSRNKKIETDPESKGILYAINQANELSQVDLAGNHLCAGSQAKVIWLYGVESGGFEYADNYAKSVGDTRYLELYGDHLPSVYNYDFRLPIDERGDVVEKIGRGTDLTKITEHKNAGSEYFVHKVLLPMLGDLEALAGRKPSEPGALDPKIHIYTHSFGGLFAQAAENSLRDYLSGRMYNNQEIQKIFNCIRIVAIGSSSFRISNSPEENNAATSEKTSVKIPVIFISHQGDLLLLGENVPFIERIAAMDPEDDCKLFINHLNTANLVIASRHVKESEGRMINPFGHSLKFYLKALCELSAARGLLNEFLFGDVPFKQDAGLNNNTGSASQALSLMLNFIIKECNAWNSLGYPHPGNRI